VTVGVRLRAAAWLLTIACGVFVTTACATTAPTPKAITDLKQLTGSWDGWIPCHGCSQRFRASLSVREDGYWTMITERNPSFHGKFGIVNGVLQWGNEGWWVGPVTVVDERGREYMSLRRANGEVWTEFDRPK
jgi:hypothetical protein